MEVLDERAQGIIDQLKQMRVNRDKLFKEISEKYLISAEEALNKRLAAEILFQQVIYYNNVTAE